MQNKKITKSILLGVLVLVCVLAFSPKVRAITAQEIQQQIAALLAQIASLQQQLAEIQGQPAQWCHTFNVNLGVGVRGSEVEALIKGLKNDGITIPEIDSYGATGPDDFLGEGIASAVVEFQEKYASEILTPLGLKRGTGYVGKATRAKLNQLYGCGVQPSICVKEGDVIFRQGTQSCCSGFSQVSRAAVSGDLCTATVVDPFDICTACGNGVCGLGENKCNCPSDCKEKSMTVISPNGGETWYFGNTYTIKWTSWGVEKAIIYLWASDGGTCLLDTVSASQGSYSFKPEENKGCSNLGRGLTAGQYKAYILTEDSPLGVGGAGARDTSDNYFSIIAATTTACIDSDGGKDYYTKGYVRPANYIAGDPNYGDHWDWCANTTVIEYSCVPAGQGIAEASQYVCLYGCQDGACKKGVTVLSPNGGEKLTIGGTYNIIWKLAGTIDKIGVSILRNHQPYCKSTGECLATIVALNTGSYSWSVPNDFEVGENYTVKIEDESNRAVYDESDNYFSIIAATTTACIDSDGGKDYQVKGECAAGNMGMWDYCSYQSSRAGILKEAFCSATGCAREDYICLQEQVCRAGRCLLGSLSDPICVDTDSGNEYIKGETNSFTISNAIDSCYVSASLDRPAGALTSACSGSETSGYCGVYEYYCSSADYNASKFIKCPNGCSNGACTLPAQKSISVVSPNGGEFFGTGQTRIIKWESKGVDKVDISLVYLDKFVKKIASDVSSINNQTYSWTVSKANLEPGWEAGNNFKIAITEKLSNGLTGVEDRSDNSFTFSITCTDSDGGKDFYIKGKTTGMNVGGAGLFTSEDTCYFGSDNIYYKNGQLIEHYCDKEYYNVPFPFTCPNGCENGVCRP